MKRLIVLFLGLLLCITPALPVRAASSVEQLRSETAVSGQGTAEVFLTVTLNMDEAVAEPVFPIPVNATEVTLNGGTQKTAVSGTVALVSLRSVTGGMAGRFAFNLRYTLSGVVDTHPTEEKGKETLLLTLPLLSGFAYQVDELTFSVTLPGEVPVQPAFTSSYHQENIQSQLAVQVSGNTVTGTLSDLKDHETLTMTLPVNEELFPQTAAEVQVMGMLDILAVALVVLAAVYYGITLFPGLGRRIHRATAPDGINAGETALWLTAGGIDLSLLVVSWAQLGYLRLQVDDNGRVLLHKRMDMGNERSVYENRCFKNLFGRRTVVDGTGYHYARLCREMSKKKPGIKDIFRPRSGNPWLFRVICLAAAALNGVMLAEGFLPHALWLKILMALMTAALAWLVQNGGACLPLREKLPLYIGLPMGFVWLVLGIAAGEIAGTVFMAAFQFAAGYAAATGGKRTELGVQMTAELMGLRRHMGTVSKKELQRLMKVNPGYFHELAPYALALDRDRRFARRFGRLRLPECTYLISGNNHQMTAGEWARLLRSTVQTLDARASRLPFEKFFNK